MIVQMIPTLEKMASKPFSNDGTERFPSHQQGLIRYEQFPWKLHRILNDAALEGNESAISWLPDGRAFRVDSDCNGVFVTRICK